MDRALTERLAFVLCLFLLLAVLERAWPRRAKSTARGPRWAGNLGLFATDVLMIGIPLNGLIFGALWWAQDTAFGLMNALALPVVVKAVLGFLALDAMFYFQHRLSHAQSALWRLHRVHHADTEMDVTTANRIHPLESIWVTFLRVSLAVALGIPVQAFVAFVVALNLTSLFNHANIALPETLDRMLRWMIVTPDMHETHHSVHLSDYDTNFGFVLSVWDRLFGTYKAHTETIDGRIELGIAEFRSAEDRSLPRLLTMPFRNERLA